MNDSDSFDSRSSDDDTTTSDEEFVHPSFFFSPEHSISPRRTNSRRLPKKMYDSDEDFIDDYNNDYNDNDRKNEGISTCSSSEEERERMKNEKRKRKREMSEKRKKEKMKVKKELKERKVLHSEMMKRHEEGKKAKIPVLKRKGDMENMEKNYSIFGNGDGGRKGDDKDDDNENEGIGGNRVIGKCCNCRKVCSNDVFGNDKYVRILECSKGKDCEKKDWIHHFSCWKIWRKKEKNEFGDIRCPNFKKCKGLMVRIEVKGDRRLKRGRVNEYKIKTPKDFYEESEKEVQVKKEKKKRKKKKKESPKDDWNKKKINWNNKKSGGVKTKNRVKEKVEQKNTKKTEITQYKKKIQIVNYEVIINDENKSPKIRKRRNEKLPKRNENRKKKIREPKNEGRGEVKFVRFNRKEIDEISIQEKQRMLYDKRKDTSFGSGQIFKFDELGLISFLNTDGSGGVVSCQELKTVKFRIEELVINEDEEEGVAIRNRFLKVNDTVKFHIGVVEDNEESFEAVSIRLQNFDFREEEKISIRTEARSEKAKVSVKRKESTEKGELHKIKKKLKKFCGKSHPETKFSNIRTSIKSRLLKEFRKVSHFVGEIMEVFEEHSTAIIRYHEEGDFIDLIYRCEKSKFRSDIKVEDLVIFIFLSDLEVDIVEVVDLAMSFEDSFIDKTFEEVDNIYAANENLQIKERELELMKWKYEKLRKKFDLMMKLKE